MKKRKVKISYKVNYDRPYTEEELKEKTQKELVEICYGKIGPLVAVSYELCDLKTLIRAIINNDAHVFYEDLPPYCKA